MFTQPKVEYRERFTEFAKADIESDLQRMALVAPIAWGYDEGGILVLTFTDERDDAMIEFTHPRSVRAFVRGYMDGYNDGFGARDKEETNRY